MIYQQNDPIIYLTVEDSANTTIAFVDITSPPLEYQIVTANN